MSEQNPPFPQRVGRSELNSLWRRWTGVVLWHAESRRRAPAISSGEYRTLHSALMAALRGSVESAEGHAAGSLRCLIDLTGPWISLESLKHAGQGTLVDLLAQCAEAERHLGIRRLSARRGRYLVAGVSALVAVALFAVVLPAWTDGQTMSPLLYSGRGYFYRAMYRVQHSTFVEQLAVISLVVMIVGIKVLRQTRTD